MGLALREPTLSLRDIDGSSRSCIARCVLISRLAECLAETERDSADNNLLAPIVGHVGDGNFHVGLIIDVEDAEEVARVKAFLERLVERALAWTEPWTGERGIGQARWCICRPSTASLRSPPCAQGLRRKMTNGYSKKRRNHKAAVALYVAHYNLCRVHETPRITPAMALGVTDHIWSIEELVAVATTEAPITDRPRYACFTVIQGGRNG